MATTQPQKTDPPGQGQNQNPSGQNQPPQHQNPPGQNQQNQGPQGQRPPGQQGPPGQGPQGQYPQGQGPQGQGPQGQRPPGQQGPPRQGPSGSAPVKKTLTEQLRMWTAHPLLLLLIGSTVTGILVPSFTHGWQQQQTAQNMKTGVISDITSATSTALTQLEISMNPILNNGVAGNNIKSPQVAGSYANWTSQAAKATSEVNAYFPENKIPIHWNNVTGLLKNFFLLTYATDPGMRQTYISSIDHYFSVHHIQTGVNWSALQTFNPADSSYRASWLKLEHAIRAVRDGVTADIMAAPAPTF